MRIQRGLGKDLATLAAGLMLVVAAPAQAATGQDLAPAAAAKQVDRLLADWNRPDSPGCAVEVIRDGKVLYRRGVGMADLERDARIAPTTPFHVASMSKQFTAFAIHLLAQDGKLALDDDIRKYLPELHDFGRTITIRHLLHHTSGLRDQWSLLALAGWRLEDVITEDDIFSLLKRQQALNFEPGQEHLYSNTGYTLLGMIVKRVSGQPLPEFAQRRIFAPLGMRHTHFHDNYGTLVKGRALSYGPSTAGDFYEYVALSYSNVGATSLFTTVDDLALWNQNFYDGRVGGKALLDQMQTPGVLNSGKAIGYASGLGIGQYRGLKTVKHGGADAGYRSELLRFPEQRFAVAILANAGDAINASSLSLKIADIYLAGQLKPTPDAGASKPSPAEVKIDPAKLDAFVGDYELSPQFVLSFTKENGRLAVQPTAQPKFQLFASGEREFFIKAVDARFTFEAPGKDGVVAGGVLHQNGRDVPARRTTPRLLDEAQLAGYAGEFYSDELHVLYTVSHRNGKLVMAYPRGEVALDHIGPHLFAASFPLGRIEFQCQPAGGCTGFTINDGRVRKLQFARVTIQPSPAA